MDLSNILLVLLSGAGLLHGLFFAVYLFFFGKKRTLPNLLLGLILVFMAFRIGKSVLLYFGENLESQFIFAGLSFLLLIGPLLRWYTMAMTKPRFKVQSVNAIEIVPFALLFMASFFVSNNWLNEHNATSVVVFASCIIFIYIHLACYILISGRNVRQVAKYYPKESLTKAQTTVLHWLKIMLIGFAIIWVTYVFNIIEETIPYIVGPIVYAVVIYYLSYEAFRMKIAKHDGSVFDAKESTLLFARLTRIMVEQKIYLETTVSLASISKLIGQSAQQTSEVINQNAKQNFNDFINYYRIQEAKKLLFNDSEKKYTIASVAFDTGFSSLSSFNSAFKKFEGTTPSSFRNGKNNK